MLTGGMVEIAKMNIVSSPRARFSSCFFFRADCQKSGFRKQQFDVSSMSWRAVTRTIAAIK